MYQPMIGDRSNSREPELPPEVMNERQAAAFLGLKANTLSKWRYSGKGPRFIRVSGACIRYRRSDLETWMDGLSASSTAEADKKRR